MSLYGEVSIRLYPCAKCREQRGPTAPGQRAGHLVEMSCHKYPMQRHCITHSSHHTHSHCKPNCSRTAAASHPLPSRRGLACASPARRRGVLLLQVYSRSTPGLLVHVVGEGGPAGPHLARLLLGVVRELQPQAALGAARRRADGPALGGESRSLVRG